jgi:NADPH:quinone reductase-like Zn-dependent oxidoreductase
LIADIKSDKAKEWLKNKTFDIIIDDGSHKPYDIMYVVDNFLKNLNLEGWMILEDCWEPERWLSFVQDLVPEGHEMSTYDARKIKNNIDDYLILINKKQ